MSLQLTLTRRSLGLSSWDRLLGPTLILFLTRTGLLKLLVYSISQILLCFRISELNEQYIRFHVLYTSLSCVKGVKTYSVVGLGFTYLCTFWKETNKPEAPFFMFIQPTAEPEANRKLNMQSDQLHENERHIAIRLERSFPQDTADCPRKATTVWRRTVSQSSRCDINVLIGKYNCGVENSAPFFVVTGTLLRSCVARGGHFTRFICTGTNEILVLTERSTSNLCPRWSDFGRHACGEARCRVV